MANVINIVGALALICGSLGYFAVPYGLSSTIKSIINLDENGKLFSIYINAASASNTNDNNSNGASQGVATRYYLFAVKNPTQMLRGSKPSFETKGPYEFLKQSTRRKIEFTEEGQKMSYETTGNLQLNEAQSADLDEEMWLVNPVAVAMASMAKKIVIDRTPFRSLAEPFVFQSLNLALDSFNERYITKTTPRKLLIGRKIGIFSTLSSLSTRYGVSSILPESVFGLVKSLNRSVSSMEIWTGVGETRDKFAEVSKHKGEKRLSVWRQAKCNKIAGTNGELFKPYPKKGKPIGIFVGALCRSITLDPIGEGELVRLESGVKAYEYELSQNIYKGVKSRPENECFCEKSRAYDCQYDGLVPVGPCFSGAPLFLTQANFKNADPKIRDLVDWKSLLEPANTTSASQSVVLPDKQLIRMDPITGFVLECDVTMMAVLKIVKNPRLTDMRKLQPLTYMPLMAISDHVVFPADKIWTIKWVQNVHDNQALVTLGSAVLGLGMLAMGSFVG